MKTIILAMGMAGLTVFGSTANAAPTVYIPLGSGNQVIAVDAATDRILATYPAVDNPHGLVATPDGEYLIAGSLVETPLPAGAAHDTPNSKLFLIHPQHGHVMRIVPVAGWSHHQAITPDGRYVLSTHPTRNAISVLDLVGNKIVQTIATGAGPNYTLITRDGKHAYVSNSGDGTISEISIPGWTIARSFAGGPEPEHLTGSRDERLLYAISPKAGTIAEIVIADGKVKRSFPVGKNAHGLDISDDGKMLFASARGEDKLVAIDIASGRTRTLTLAPAPYHLNTIHGAGKVYVSSSKKPVIWVVDQKSLKLVGTIALPAGEGHQMAVVE